MIKLFTTPAPFDPKRVDTEYSCPYCYKPIKWQEECAMSPIQCPGCLEKLIDLSSLILFFENRAAYHTKEEIL